MSWAKEEWPLLALLAALAVGGGLVIYFVMPRPMLDSAVLSISIGTFFGQACLAAAWLGMGPGPLSIRAFGSTCWLAALEIAAVLCFDVPPLGHALFIAVVTGTVAVVQCAAVQLPCLAVTQGLNFHLRQLHGDDDISHKRLQFGLRELLVVTAVVAALLGLGRAAWSHYGDFDRVAPLLLVLAACAACAMLVSGAVLAVSIVARRSPLFIVYAITVVVCITASEIALLGVVYSDNSEEARTLISLFNGTVGAWSLLFAGALWLRGYRWERGGLTRDGE